MTAAWERFCAWADRRPEVAERLLMPFGLVLWIGSCAVHLVWSIVEDLEAKR